MKLFNVTGDMFETGSSCPTQDIEFNSTPALDLADARTTREIIGLRIKYAKRPERAAQTSRKTARHRTAEGARRRAAHTPGEYAAVQPDSLLLWGLCGGILSCADLRDAENALRGDRETRSRRRHSTSLAAELPYRA